MQEFTATYQKGITIELIVDDHSCGYVRRIEWVQNDPIDYIYIGMKDDLTSYNFPLSNYEVIWDNSDTELIQVRVTTLEPATPRTADLHAVLPGLMKHARCPVCQYGSDEEQEGTALKPAGLALWNVIIHLNDEHKKSREYIADWLESLDIDLEFRMEV